MELILLAGILTVADSVFFANVSPSERRCRSDVPFLVFLLPHYYSDVAQSIVEDAEENGGNVCLLVQQNAYAFGATDFSTASAVKYLDANASRCKPTLPS